MSFSVKKMWIESLSGIWEMAWGQWCLWVPGSPTLGSPRDSHRLSERQGPPVRAPCTLTHPPGGSHRNGGQDGSRRAALVFESPQRPTSSKPEGQHVTQAKAMKGPSSCPEFLFLLPWGLTWDFTALE